MIVAGHGDSITMGFSASNRATLRYVPLVAAALGQGVANHAISGATMNGGPGVGQASILTAVQAVPPPTRLDVAVTIVGTNDIIAYGTNATRLDEFAAGLTTVLLHVTSRRRIPEPRTPAERLLVAQGRQLPSVADTCPVFVGNCPRQSPYSGSASSAAQIAYANRTADVVAAVAALGRPVYLVDVASAFDPTTQSADGIHPNDDGHADIAAAFLAAIEAHT